MRRNNLFVSAIILLCIITVNSSATIVVPSNTSVDITNSSPTTMNSSGQPQQQFERGATVKVRFYMRNYGPDTLYARIVLNTKDSASNVFYDSHTSGGDTVITIWGIETKSATFEFTIPQNAALGWCKIGGAVRDGRSPDGFDVVYDDTEPGRDTKNLGSSAWLTAFEIVAPAHTVSQPAIPSGTDGGNMNTSYTYSTGGSSCNQGHSVQYRFEWGDGGYSSWSSNTSASYSWSNLGNYTVRAQARCSNDPSIISSWSSEKIVSITMTPKVETPVFNPDTGAYIGNQNVVVTCSTSNATIHYTTNGNTPTESDPVISSGAIEAINSSLTLKAKAWKGGYEPSDVKSAYYDIQQPNQKPVANAGGPYKSKFPDTTIQFSGSAFDPDGDDIIGWHWDFGDDTTSTQESPTHTFISNREYTVFLIVTDEAGLSSDASYTKVEISRPNIAAVIVGSNTTFGYLPVKNYAKEIATNLRTRGADVDLVLIDCDGGHSTLNGTEQCWSFTSIPDVILSLVRNKLSFLEYGDSFIFTFSGHGDFWTENSDLTTETPVTVVVPYNENDPNIYPDNKSDEFLVLAKSGTQRAIITDNNLADVLKNYPDIRKTIILSSCFSGGFWGDPENKNNNTDLSLISNVGLLAGSPETYPLVTIGIDCWFNPHAKNVARALEKDRDLHTFDELANFIKYETTIDYNLSSPPYFILSEPGEEVNEIIGQPVSYCSSDFNNVEVISPYAVLQVPSQYPTIQSAINAASDGEKIIVEPCTYYGNINFYGKNITLTSANPGNSNVVASTIIDGGGNGSVVTFNSNEDANCVLTGFTIRGGNAQNGGGIYIGSAAPCIQYCKITNNQAYRGAGIYFSSAKQVVAWGEGSFGLCDVPAGNDFTAIAAGYAHSIALQKDGSLVAWGGNSRGQCDVPIGNDFTAIVAGCDHSLALRTDGSLVAWGSNYSGLCDVPAGNDFTAIAADGGHSLALRTDGSLAAWGDNSCGQCDVPTGNDFTAIATGWTHSIALRTDGSLAAWGDNSCGQCDVPIGNDFTAIAAGFGYSLSLRANGSLVAWGSNYSGRCDVPAGDDFTAIAAGYAHSIALQKDGSLIAWGENGCGQCDIPSGNDYVAIAAGGYHSLATKSTQLPSVFARNCVITRNSTIADGGIYGGTGEIKNCTIAYNAGSGVSDFNGLITNSIIWGNENYQLLNCSTPTYSCIEGGSTGVENIDHDPLFIKYPSEFWYPDQNVDIDNGGFENGDISNWTVEEYGTGYADIYPWGLTEGDYHLAMSVYGNEMPGDPFTEPTIEFGECTLSRTILLPEKGDYTIKFDYTLSLSGYSGECHVEINGHCYDLPNGSFYDDPLNTFSMPCTGIDSIEFGIKITAGPPFEEIFFLIDNLCVIKSGENITDSDDYHLLPGSSCIDTGDPNSECSNEPWPNGGRINMGAYGNTPEATHSRDGLVPAGFEIVNKTRVGRTEFEYELALRVQNQNSCDVTNVQMRLVDATECVTSVTDNSVVIDAIGAGQVATSEDTFKLVIDRSQLIESGHLTWEFTYYAVASQPVSQAISMNISLSDLEGSTIKGDLTGEGNINFVDLTKLAERWLWAGTAGGIPEDINKDGSVDFLDFTVLAGNWMK